MKRRIILGRVSQLILVVLAAVLLACGKTEYTVHGPYEVTYRSGDVDTAQCHMARHATWAKMLVFYDWTGPGTRVQVLVVPVASVKKYRSLNVKGRKIEV